MSGRTVMRVLGMLGSALLLGDCRPPTPTSTPAPAPPTASADPVGGRGARIGIEPTTMTAGQSFARRLALVIGNGRYESVGRLANPENDARDVSRLLQELGFNDVQTRVNLGRAALAGTVEGFVRELQTGDLAMIYYAGHGVSVGGNNYLLPTDFSLSYTTELEQHLAANAYPLEQLLQSVRARSSVNVLVFDACRNNPWAERARSLARATGVSRGVGRGLDAVSAPRGSLVAFSTSPGQTADDGEGEHSVFTAAFLRRAREPVDLQNLLTRIVGDVEDATGGRQTPWQQSSLRTSVYMQASAVERVTPSTEATPTPRPAIQAASSAPSTPTCPGSQLWNAGANRCECPASTPNFNTSTQQCVGTCYPGSSWNASRNGCDCEPGMVWNANVQRCGAPLLATPPTASPSPVLGSVVGGCPSGLVYVPGGTFRMGSSASEPGSGDDERPVHAVTLSPYCMGRTEVTGGEYRACVDQGRCSAPRTGGSCNWGVGGREDHPVNCVDWSQAHSYCAFRGQRLPTEAEWEFAASVGGTRRYPWGDAAPSNQLCWRGSGDRSHTCAVGSFLGGNTPSGISDLSGNVWEWLSDWYDGYSGESVTNPAGANSGFYRVCRGGCGSTLESRRVGARDRFRRVPASWNGGLGFRCASGTR